MTGFGNATKQSDAAYVVVELKAVNNRYLKVSMRLPDFLGRFESDIEKLLREKIGRGSVQLAIRVRLNAQVTGYSIDQSVLRQYVEQVSAAANELDAHIGAVPQLADLLPLPGVIAEAEVTADLMEVVWPTVESALREALEHFHEFRRTEGESMKDDLTLQCATIRQKVDEVAEHAPEVVSDYRAKLLDRLQRALAESDVQIHENDLIREVALFADKCDINEEITRLRSHLKQFDGFLSGEKSMGRKLEFLGQEMFREINTIGSKANNVSIAHGVVEMKAAIERIREVLQNVE